MTKGSIELCHIEEELKRLRECESGKHKVHASLFNLIIYVDQEERTALYEKLIKTVVSHFPSRILLIVAHPQGEDHLSSQVTAETLQGGELEIFCEVIRLEVGGAFLERIPFLVLPQLLPDLPTHLLWASSDLRDQGVLIPLERIAKRVIFDSERISNLREFSLSILHLLSQFHAEVSDLNWSALRPWRHLLANQFATDKELRSLEEATLIRLTYAMDHQNLSEIEAAYLQAWLATQLNWKFARMERSEENIRLTYQRTGGEVALLLAPERNSGLPAGALSSIEVESAYEKGHTLFKRDPFTRQVHIQYSNALCCLLPTYTFLSSLKADDEIIDEIFSQETSATYRAMLHTLSQIPWK